MDIVLRVIYYVVLICSAFYSIYILKRNTAKSQNYFFVYLLVTLFVEVVANIFEHVFAIKNSIVYNVHLLFCTVYVCIFYWLVCKKKKYRIWLVSLVSIVSIILVYFYTTKDIHLLIIENAIVLCFFTIFLVFTWFIYSILSPDENPIQHKQEFWVSVAWMLWSVVFLFRIVPMYYFNIHDIHFLVAMQYIFNVCNIITYLFFLKSLSVIQNK